MRLELSTLLLAPLASLALLALPVTAFADDDDDTWEEKDECDEEDDDDEEYQNSLYDSQTYSYTTEQHQVVYDAELAPGRRVRFLARLSDAPGERPVLIVSHGGAAGKTNPATALRRWSEFFASHGYHVLTPAHAPRTQAQKAALCATFDLPEGEACGAGHAWDRPSDVAELIDFLEVKAEGDWAGRVDLDAIGMLGHSAGASATLIVGGATRQVGLRQLDKGDARVRAAIASSPSGIRPDNGQSPGSWQGVDIPVLVLTGSADIVDPNQPENYRRDAFWGLPGEEDNRLLFFQSAGATHGLFGLNAALCRRRVGDVKCREIADAMQSAALAHFDAYLGDDNTAKDWLEDEVVDEVVTPGLADLTTREDVDGFGDDD